MEQIMGTTEISTVSNITLVTLQGSPATTGFMAEVFERIAELEKQVADLRAKLANAEVPTERERAILDMWPRFEDGEYVWFGDEVEMQDEIVREVWTFTLDVNAEGDKRLYLNGFQGLFVLPGERVKRPAPKVLDADGVEIKVGDTVWTLDGLEGIVTKVEDGAACIAYESDYAQREEADNLTHTRPDSREQVVDMLERGVVTRIDKLVKEGRWLND